MWYVFFILIVFKIDNERICYVIFIFLNPVNKDQRIFKSIWFFGRLVLTLYTYLSIHLHVPEFTWCVIL